MRRPSILLPVLLLAACSSPSGPGDAVFVRLGLAEARWQESRPWSYEIVQQRGCECTVEMSGPVRIHVMPLASRPPAPDEAETITSMTYEGSGQSVPAEYRPGFLTISQLFDFIRAAIARDAYLLEAEFDPRLGYPVRVSVDFDREMVDDEIVYTIVEFVEGAVAQD